MAKKRVVIMEKKGEKEVEKKQETRLSNSVFAKSDKIFKAACAVVVIKGETLAPTIRQASKFRRRKGLAFNKGLPALKTNPKAWKDATTPDTPKDTKGEALDSGHEGERGGEKDINDEARSETEG